MTSIFPGGEDWTDSPSTATALDAANLKSNESAIKAYDDALASAKELLPAQAVAVVNVALSGLTAVDGYTPVDGDRVLLSGQTASSQNGPWVAHSGAWTRPSDWVSGASVGSHHMLVSGGTAFRDTVWLMGVTAPIVVDTGAQVWSLPPVFASQLPASVANESQGGPSGPLVTRSGTPLVNVGDFVATTLYPAGYIILHAGSFQAANVQFTTGSTYSAADWTTIAGASGGITGVTASISASGGTLATGKLNPVDTTASGASTQALPTTGAAGNQIAVQRVDALQATNSITLTGSIRGVGSSSIALNLGQYETLVLVQDSALSWWPLSSHKTTTSLDVRYGADIALGSIGVSTTLAIGSSRNLTASATLTENAALTVSFAAPFTATVIVTQTGGPWVLTVNGQPLTLPRSGATCQVILVSVDGANLFVGLAGGQGPTGLTGPQGARGVTWFVGTGAPGTVGGAITNDLYINKTTGEVWQSTSGSNVWTDLGFALSGPTGATGTGVIAPTTVTASGTVTVPSGAGHARITAIGGGGGGGGAGSAAATQLQGGAGGGAAGVPTTQIVALTSITSLVVVIGAGGAPGAGGAAGGATGTNGGIGGNSTVTATGISVVGLGGAIGQASGASTATAGQGGVFGTIGVSALIAGPGSGGCPSTSTGGAPTGFAAGGGSGGGPATTTLGGGGGGAGTLTARSVTGLGGASASASGVAGASAAANSGGGGGGGGGGAAGTGAGGAGGTGGSGSVYIEWLA